MEENGFQFRNEAGLDFCKNTLDDIVSRITRILRSVVGSFFAWYGLGAYNHLDSL